MCRPAVARSETSAALSVHHPRRRLVRALDAIEIHRGGLRAGAARAVVDGPKAPPEALGLVGAAVDQIGGFAPVVLEVVELVPLPLGARDQAPLAVPHAAVRALVIAGD